ncbi:MAG: aromatic ring-hydroxylating dioxygenase subunit alpha [Candidatus Obscuribacterales bacterium]
MPEQNDIRNAYTISADFYRNENLLSLVKENIFARSWQFVTHTARLKAPGHAVPLTMLEGFLNEPVLLTRDSADQLHCLSNVCTHRGNILTEGECHATSLRCRYHGRRFNLDGKIASAPGFEDALDFPAESDNLTAVPFALWKTMLFVNASVTQPLFTLAELVADMDKRLGWLPLEKFLFDSTGAREYLVKANWALYCENYLEGMHIPYVHPDLATALDIKDYRSEIYEYSNLQIGIASSAQECFDLPRSSPDFGERIGGYYYWLFPNMMFNFYPWGLSINVVQPLGQELTKVVFLPYVLDESKRALGAGAALDRVEREDEEIVERVQQGVKSRFYKRGRYAPRWEKGVKHFHDLLKRFVPEID